MCTQVCQLLHLLQHAACLCIYRHVQWRRIKYDTTWPWKAANTDVEKLDQQLESDVLTRRMQFRLKKDKKAARERKKEEKKVKKAEDAKAKEEKKRLREEKKKQKEEAKTGKGKKGRKNDKDTKEGKDAKEGKGLKKDQDMKKRKHAENAEDQSDRDDEKEKVQKANERMTEDDKEETLQEEHQENPPPKGKKTKRRAKCTGLEKLRKLQSSDWKATGPTKKKKSSKKGRSPVMQESGGSEAKKTNKKRTNGDKSRDKPATRSRKKTPAAKKADPCPKISAEITQTLKECCESQCCHPAWTNLEYDPKVFQVVTYWTRYAVGIKVGKGHLEAGDGKKATCNSKSKKGGNKWRQVAYFGGSTTCIYSNMLLAYRFAPCMHYI